VTEVVELLHYTSKENKNNKKAGNKETEKTWPEKYTENEECMSIMKVMKMDCSEKEYKSSWKGALSSNTRLKVEMGVDHAEVGTVPCQPAVTWVSRHLFSFKVTLDTFLKSTS
jgi:hypothetical protein